MDATTSAGTPPQAAPATPSVVGRLGPYRLLQVIGGGGMGVVHLGLDPAGRAVAIKVLRPHVAADPSARSRLAREVDALQRVRSPRVAEVLDADPSAEQPYVVTEFVPAPPLDVLVEREGPLTGRALGRIGLAWATRSRRSTPPASSTATSSPATCSSPTASPSSSTSGSRRSPTTSASPAPAWSWAPPATSPRRCSTARPWPRRATGGGGPRRWPSPPPAARPSAAAPPRPCSRASGAAPPT
ncbi:protein kinase [Quadrisphaera sp. INWT6]|nr:protein kinase [Quadrisphaera sp. INWT6]